MRVFTLLCVCATASGFVMTSSRSVSRSYSRLAFAKQVGAVAVGTASLLTATQSALAATNNNSKSGYDLTPMTQEQVETAAAGFSDISQKVLLKAGTERSRTGVTVNGYTHAEKGEGTWVSAVSGVPLFKSSAKYESGTGWPSFYAPYDPEHVIERIDPKDKQGLPEIMWRTEVLDRKSGTHIGHVFSDGPKPTGKRYCMNAASMAFIPKGQPLPKVK